MDQNPLFVKSFNFSLQIITLYKALIAEKEYVLSKQLLRSATSIGANVSEANYALSTKDFYHKLNTSRKEANESRYWLQLLSKSGYLKLKEGQELIEKCDELMRILTSSINTTRKKMK